MQVHGSKLRDAQVILEFTGAELKKFYPESKEYFICNAITWAFERRYGATRYPESVQVIKSLRAAVPKRFKKTDPDRGVKNVVGGWILQKYKAGNEREYLVNAVPDDFVFKIVMHVGRVG